MGKEESAGGGSRAKGLVLRGPVPGRSEPSKGHCEVNIGNESGIRDPQLRIMRTGTRTPCEYIACLYQMLAYYGLAVYSDTGIRDPQLDILRVEITHNLPSSIIIPTKIA